MVDKSQADSHSCGFHLAHESRLKEHDRRLQEAETDVHDLQRESNEQGRRIGDRVPIRHALWLATLLASVVISLFGLNYSATSKMVGMLQSIDSRMVKVETILEEREYQNKQFDRIRQELDDFRRERR